jgi:heavy metal efflux system protein
VPGAADVKLESTTGLPLLSISPDPEALVRYGLNTADVQEAVSVAVGGAVAGQLFEGDRRFDLVVRLPEELRSDPARLADLPVPLPHQAGSVDESSHLANWASGGPGVVPLRELARIEVTEAPNQINRENGKRRVVISANVRGRDLAGFVAELGARIDAEVDVPPGYWVDYGGSFEQLISCWPRSAPAAMRWRCSPACRWR